MVVLGVSAGYHDAAAAVVVDGRVVAAAQEERFSRIKHDPAWPARATAWCLAEIGIDADDLESVVFYDKPYTSYERILATHAAVGPRGFGQLSRAVRTWSRHKLWVAAGLEGMLGTRLGRGRLLYAEHHVSHAAAAFYPSPFEDAAVLTVDGVGEWATTTRGHGSGERLRLDAQLDFPDSVGLLYSAATAYLGFEVNEGEYKVMGLAPYGTPRFAPALREHVVHVAADGAVRLDQRYFDYQAGMRMCSPRLHDLLGGPPRSPDEPIDQRHADVASSVQAVLEDAVLALAAEAGRVSRSRRLCLGGGVALNCVANGRVMRELPFEDVWIQPAAGDAGSALGAALWAVHEVGGADRVPLAPDGMAGAALGPAFSNDVIADWLSSAGVHHRTPGPDLSATVARSLAAGAVVGWFRGRAEFGPRALGHRSILADPRDPAVVGRVNRAVKGREGFRPFAPSVTQEAAGDWFETDRPLPYMLVTVPVRSFVQGGDAGSASFAERLGSVRSALPACTHVDGSARVQTVDRVSAPDFHALLEAFGSLTGCPVLLNTSFNRAGEPIVGSPADALRCAAAADLDLLVLEDCVIDRDELRRLADLMAR